MTTEERAAERNARKVQRVLAWLDVIEQSARDLELALLSRTSETASGTGTDPEPRLRPCEHRSEWQRGRLCLACDNTGLRPATDRERTDGLAYDPYLIDPPRDTYNVVRDQSEAARRSRDLAQLDAAIEVLQRTADERDGLAARERNPLRLTRTLEGMRRCLGRDGRRVLDALARIREVSPDAYRLVLARDETAVALLARIVRGRLRSPLLSASSGDYYGPEPPPVAERKLGRGASKNYPRSTLH